MSRPRIVVAGGGFAGLVAARELCRSGRADVQLVDRHNYFVFKPLLAEVATGAVTATHAVVPLRSYLTPTRPIRAQVVGVDPQRRRLHLRYGRDRAHTASLDYDILILALGAQTDFFGIEGLAEHALTLDTVGDALAWRGRILSRLEQAEVEPAGESRRSLLTFVVGGGSFTGVEAAGAIADYLRRALAHYPRLSPSDTRVLLIEMKGRLLAGLPDRVGDVALHELRRRGVEVRLDTAFQSLHGDTLTLADGTRVRAGSVLWAGGVRPNPLIGELPLPTDDRGRVVVDDMLTVDAPSALRACGDCAAVPDGAGGFQPPTAQHALREGRYLAADILRQITGDGSRAPFRYRGKGMLVSLGERRAAGTVLGRTITGVPAWMLWRAYYLGQLPTIGRRVRVGLDWLLNAFTGPTLVDLPIFGQDDPRTQRAAESPAGRGDG